jgi:hypothetical protein
VKIYTLDLETDPFEYEKKVKPFCAGLYDGENFYKTWGENCVEQMLEIISRLPHGYIYAHNGGRFDFFWFLKYAKPDADMIIIKNRIVKFVLETGHEVRDSFKLFPFALEVYKKTKVDYERFKEGARELYRDYILDYLRDDCRDLYDLIVAYFEQFGESLTIGTTAFKELKKLHEIGGELNGAWDKHIRDRYYFGGRVERYNLGVFYGDFSVIDLNSAYPAAMRDYLHPIGTPKFGKEIGPDTCFLTVSGRNDGAFPARTNTGLRFDVRQGTFSTTIHEFRAALDTGRFKLQRVIQTLDFSRRVNFQEYIDKYYGLRVRSDELGDKLRKLLFKFLLNNSYGKFAINPNNYKDYIIRNDWEQVDLCDCERRKCICGRWRPTMIIPEHRIIMYDRPSVEVRRMNIATGASITGATRAMLMKGLSNVEKPWYCDTDSIIFSGRNNNELDGSKLGVWKFEGSGQELAIAGRKMYALFRNGEAIKYASKGVQISPSQIRRVAEGEKLIYKQAAPVFKLDGSIDFIEREVVRV